MMVQTPALGRALTTPARAKSLSTKLSAIDDAVLTAQINEASDRIAALIGVSSADDGTVTLGYEEVQEEFRVERDPGFLLNRFPVVSITTFQVDGTAVPVGEYAQTGRLGRVEFTDASLRRINRTGAVLIRYFAGWFLPTETNYPTLPSAPPTPPMLMPDAIENAVVELLGSLADDDGRDMGLREEQSDEVDRFQYFAGGASAQSWRTVRKRIAPYIRMII